MQHPPVDRSQAARTGDGVRALVAAAYDQVAAGYDQAYADPAHRAEDAWLAAWLRARVDLTGWVLDLGCGTGWVLDHLQVAADHYLGVDLSAGMLAQARAKHPGHAFEQADMARLRAPRAASTVLSVFGALNHHPHPQAALQAAAQVLRPGGRLLLVAYGPRPQPLDVFTGDGVAPPPLRRFDPTALRWMVEGAGLAVLELRGFRRPRPRLPRRAPYLAQRAWLTAEQAVTLSRPQRAVYLLLAAERRT